MNWGRYGAFQIVSGVVVSAAPVDHPLFKGLTGLSLGDFVAASEASHAKASGGGVKRR